MQLDIWRSGGQINIFNGYLQLLNFEMATFQFYFILMNEMVGNYNYERVPFY